MGALKQALAQGLCAGECALLMAEQLAFQQRLRQGGAVDLDKRAVCTARAVVNGAGNQLFAGSTLSADQYVGLRKGNFRGVFANLHHVRAVGQDMPPLPAGAQGLMQAADLLLHRLQLQRALDQ